VVDIEGVAPILAFLKFDHYTPDRVGGPF
jgi:hypothetical protein